MSFQAESVIRKALRSKADRQMFEARFKRHAPDLLASIESVYGNQSIAMLQELLSIMLDFYRDRSEDLKQLDLERMLKPDWFQEENMLAYVCYTERFADNLQGIQGKLDHLQELGVTYLHLMPMLQPRPAPNDGGYAVQDYYKIREDLGTETDLEALTTALRKRKISLCMDLVLNHVAEEHEWAEKARQGSTTHQSYFHTYADRTLPDQYEQTLLEIFPDFAPGNFTWDERLKRWVWTTFNSWQWDLNWSNPAVFLEFVKIILFWANKGVDVFRLDAIAFIWKRMGTDCQNLPEVHDITQALRAVVRIVAPAVLFKAEAIVAPEKLIHYLGRGQHYGKVSDLAYHNSLMVQIWSSLASRNTFLMQKALQNFPEKPTSASWATYVRCHDDIGWAISDEDAAQAGLHGESHRRFLSDFYSGNFEGSHARGLVFQENKRTGDRRISGSMASLNGLEVALQKKDRHLQHLAIERNLLAYALVLGYGGIPLLYMGDELACLNDYRYTENPEHAMDNRWVHRPEMDWTIAEQRHDPSTPHGQMFLGLKHLIETRKMLPQLHAGQPVWVLNSEVPSVLVIERPHPMGHMLQFYNFSEHHMQYPIHILHERGYHQPMDHIAGTHLDLHLGYIPLPPYARVWVTNRG